jgi:outer membrane biosynthesis protein TonB
VHVASIPTTSQDPHADPAQEIEAAAARSQPAFARCASEHGPARGAITIAFQVRPDGRVANAAAVENSTGNGELARCLVAEIASWRVSAHGGAAINMSRPFTYP